MAQALIIGEAQPKQREFMLAREKYIAFGGARGGGKSWVLREKLKRMAIRYPGIKMLLVRKHLEDLRLNHINPLRADIPECVARYKESEKTFYFFNGSILKLAYFKHDNDAIKYQGQEYDIIAIEEATQMTEQVFIVFKACLRGANSFPKRIYITCNPGGVGFSWVKRLFIERDFHENEHPEDYRFIQSLVDDNQVLVKSDPDYVRQLDELPPDLRDMWRWGKWDVLAGQYFNEFRRERHVIAPIPLDPAWRRYRAIDYGLDGLACVWAAIDYDGNVYIYRELQVEDAPIYEAGQLIRDMTPGDERIYLTLAPPDLWGRSQESGRSKADIFREAGVVLTTSSNDREAGWLGIKDLLRLRGTPGRPKLYIFADCVKLIRNLPLLMRDEKKPDDCATEPHDITHLPDALRYLIVYWLRGNKLPEARPQGNRWHEDLLDDYRRGTPQERAEMERLYGKPPRH